MEKKKQTPQKRADIYYQFYDLTSVESEQGLTGLVPAMPTEPSKLSAYAELEGTPVEKDDI